ncbi:MAG: hypothetical protein LBV13_05135 [Methanomassiliicoccaceae archaeon]|nr:hypothetical protein [Methanomassiliicoccaceae archaeon]
MERAMEIIESANSKVGCRVVRLDCRPSLVKYYTDNGFVHAYRDTERGLDRMAPMI